MIKKILRKNDKTYWSGNKGENNRQILSRFFDNFKCGCLLHWYHITLINIIWKWRNEIKKIGVAKKCNDGYIDSDFYRNFLCYILQLIHCVVKAHDFRKFIWTYTNVFDFNWLGAQPRLTLEWIYDTPFHANVGHDCPLFWYYFFLFSFISTIKYQNMSRQSHWKLYSDTTYVKSSIVSFDVGNKNYHIPN